MSESPRYNDVMTPLGPRNRHLIRPATPEPFHLVARDIDCLALVGRLRFATPEHAATVLGGSQVNIRRRFHRMWRAHLLSRPMQQQVHLTAHAYNGSGRIIYELARSGARLLEERGIRLRIDQTFRQTTTVSPLLHALEITTFIVELMRDVARIPNIRLVDHADLIESFPEKTRASRRPFSLTVTFEERGRYVTKTNTPDRLFSLHLLDSDQRFNFGYECDRGTESVRPQSRSTANKSTIHRKLTVMHRAYREQLFASRWNFQRLRVLFETTSERRIAAMVDTQHHLVTHGHAASMFLYTTNQRRAAGGPLGAIWVSAVVPPIAEELAHQAELLKREPKRLTSDRRIRIDRLAKIIAELPGQPLLPAVPTPTPSSQV